MSDQTNKLSIVFLLTVCFLGIILTIPVFKLSASYAINEGDLIRGPDGIKVYIVNDKSHGQFSGWKRHIFNPAVFNMYQHFKWDSIKTVDQETIDAYQTSDLYRALGDDKVYRVEEINEVSGLAVKCHVTAETFIERGLSWDQVFTINNAERDFYPVPETIIPTDCYGGSPIAQ